jgi:hypothetical protein
MANNPDNIPYRRENVGTHARATGVTQPQELASLVIPRWRCRPDGHQHWLRLELAPATASRLRTRAREAGVGVDAWLGIALAMRVALFGEETNVMLRRLRAAIGTEPVPIAGERRVRAWQRYLAQRDSPGLHDELPEVVLPDSIVEEVPHDGAREALALEPEEWELGRECEIRAAGAGIPLPAYIRTLAGRG